MYGKLSALFLGQERGGVLWSAPSAASSRASKPPPGAMLSVTRCQWAQSTEAKLE